MKFSHSKIFVMITIIAMIFSSGSAVFAASPNDQVISAINGAGIPGTASYAGLADSFLRDTGKVLTQTEADQISVNISNATAIYNKAGGVMNLAVSQDIYKQFEAATEAAGFTLSDLSRTADGVYTFTVYDPASGKSVTVQGNVTTGVTNTGTATSGFTMVAKTALDNSLFGLAAVLAIATIGAGVVVYRKKAIQ